MQKVAKDFKGLHMGLYLDFMGLQGILKDCMELYKILKDLMSLQGIIIDHMGLYNIAESVYTRLL